MARRQRGRVFQLGLREVGVEQGLDLLGGGFERQRTQGLGRFGDGLADEKRLRRGAGTVARIAGRTQHCRIAEAVGCGLAQSRRQRRKGAAQIVIDAGVRVVRGNDDVEAGRQDRAGAHRAGIERSDKRDVVRRRQLAPFRTLGEVPVDQLALAVRGRIEDQAIAHDVVLQRLENAAVLVQQQAADAEGTLRLGGECFAGRDCHGRLDIDRLHFTSSGPSRRMRWAAVRPRWSRAGRL